MKQACRARGSTARARQLVKPRCPRRRVIIRTERAWLEIAHGDNLVRGACVQFSRAEITVVRRWKAVAACQSNRVEQIITDLPWYSRRDLRSPLERHRSD